MHARMKSMSRPNQRDQDVHIHQVCAHASDSRSFTCVVVTTGESGGRSNTRNPLTMRVGRRTVKPRRTSSETALPTDMERLCAYVLMQRKTSSSSESVVRIPFMMSDSELDVK